MYGSLIDQLRYDEPVCVLGEINRVTKETMKVILRLFEDLCIPLLFNGYMGPLICSFKINQIELKTYFFRLTNGIFLVYIQ